MKDVEKIAQNPVVIAVSAIFCCLLWGSAFSCIKIGYRLFDIASDQTATIILFAGLRFTLAGSLSITGLSLANRRVMRPPKQSLKQITFLSFTQTVGQYSLFYIGLAHATGTISSIIKALNVFLVILISCLIFRQEKLQSNKLAGCAVGFLGVLLVNASKSDTTIGFSLLGEGFILLSTIVTAFASCLSKKYSRTVNPVLLSGWQFFIGGLILVLGGVAFGGRLRTVTLPGILMLIYLALVSSIAFSVWTTLLKYNPISRVTIYSFMNPVFGVILSALLLMEKEQLNSMCIAALLLISVGIYIVNRKKSAPPEK